MPVDKSHGRRGSIGLKRPEFQHFDWTRSRGLGVQNAVLRT